MPDQARLNAEPLISVPNNCRMVEKHRLDVPQWMVEHVKDADAIPLLRGLAERYPDLSNLPRNQGGSTLVCANLDSGVRKQRKPREHDRPGPHRDTYS